MRNNEDVENSRLQFREKVSNGTVYEKKVVCPECGGRMMYIYGEMYECTDCGCKALSDFGKVRRFLEDNGPQTAMKIADATGVPMETINKFLRDGRIEIPDGSEQYIRCQTCGADIRYGRYCPECVKKTSGSIAQALWNPDVGERPRKKFADGRMHFLGEDKVRNTKKK